MSKDAERNGKRDYRMKDRLDHERLLESLRRLNGVMAKNNAAVLDELDDVTTLLIYSLAVDVVAHRISPSEVRRFCPPDNADHILHAAIKIARLRRRNARKSGPLIIVGPGGDYTSEIYPEDL